MSWTLTDTDEGRRHTGYLLGRLADGTVPMYRRGSSYLERTFTDSPGADGGTWNGPEHGRPTEQPAALTPACRCGWRGPDLPYDSGPPVAAPLGDGQGHDARLRWLWHATAVLVPDVPDRHREQLAAFAGTLGELADERPRAALTLARQLREIADHLEPLALAEALAQRATWDTIGADLGQSRQAVHGRYVRRPSPELDARVRDLTGDGLAALLDAAKERRPGTPPPGHGQWPEAVRRITGVALDTSTREGAPHGF
ncbi:MULTISPECIES: hypothetical protein [unclassified Streptomyces]|uniref:hypothetical protein n=1 Tax=unclassified Streptomyces TaxID=2593676 RepID=UPI0033DD91BF